MNGQQTRHTAATCVLSAHCMTRALWGNHQTVDIAARLDQVEMHIQPMGKRDGGTRADIGMDVIAIDVCLQFIRCQHHDQITPCCGLSHIHDLEPGFSSLWAAG